MAENKWGFTGVMTHPEISGVKWAPTSKVVGAHFVEIPLLNIQVSHEKNNLLLSMKYCLFNRDPYFMVYEQNPYITE